MNTVAIEQKTYVEAASLWTVSCRVETDSGTRIGTEYVTGAPTMTDDEIKTAILALYA